MRTETGSQEVSHAGEGEGLELPANTTAPLYFALGFAFLGVSLVTSVLFVFAGVMLVLWGGIRWWGEVLPRENETFVPAQAEADRAPPVVPTPGRAPGPAGGADRHRARLPLEYHPYSAGLRAGIAGGLAMVAVAGVHGLIVQGSLWHAFNGFAALVLPLFGAQPPSDMTSFHGVVVLAAGIIHILLSLGIGLVYAAVLPMLPGHPRLWGGVVAPLVWTGAGFVCVELVVPGAVQSINWLVFIFLQMVFGLTAGEVISRSEPVRTLQSYPLTTRAGLEVGDEEESP
ncbi:MAG TPA: hypothetical protein EYQ54_15720 [Myxococcales bacterium]|nr:hypothetical protein [Myxococcales bacterium]